MNIRTAAVDDVATIAALERSLFGVDAWTASQVTEELSGPGRSVHVAEDDGVIGYVVFSTGLDVVDLLRIGVLPRRQREGIATLLLECDRRMMLEVSATNCAAIAFYTHEGFVEVDRRSRYYRDGSDAVVMQRGARR